MKTVMTFLAISFLLPAAAIASAAPLPPRLEYSLPANLPPNIADDDILNAQVDRSKEYEALISAPQKMVPASNLPPEIFEKPSNNNVSIAYFNGRLYMAWRTGKTHFASANVHMYVASSADFGKTWIHENTIFMGSDMREPFLLSFKGRLVLTFFQAGRKATAFEPKFMWRTEKLADGTWSPLRPWGRPGEIAWELKVRNGRAWMTSYMGAHYSGSGGVDVFFQTSDDGWNWKPVDPNHPVSYHGGVSEVAFDFDQAGNLWGVTRNEDGDDTGFGSHVAFASAANVANWSTPAKSNPNRYDSPRMLRHGKDLYLVARRDIGGPFDKGSRFLPQSLRKYVLWLKYWFRPKRTALYKIDTEHHHVAHVMDLPGDGDTAFPSILRLDADTFLVANYTSPLNYPNRSWYKGQTSKQGTQIYFMMLRFAALP
ncbi:MAG: hypothetical protein HY074_00065 [Deltaproteobacteria bacterium]|nr:hypothetical protein [Deltaproteobacteria bacterium]